MDTHADKNGSVGSNFNFKLPPVKDADIPLNKIMSDDAFNSRGHLDGYSPGGDLDSNTKVQALADSMNTASQITPILVEQRKDKFYLISGFRRVAAAKLLGWDTIRARVFEPMSEATRRYLNLLENTARQDLSTYDLAKACSALIKLGEDSNVVAGKIGKSSSYVRSLSLIFDNAVPSIKRRWETETAPGFGGKPCLPTDWLAKVTKMAPEAQEKELTERLATKDKKANRADGTGDPNASGGDKPTVAKSNKPSKIALENARSVVKAKLAAEQDKTMKIRLEMVLETLRYALGDQDTGGIPAIFTSDEVKNYGREPVKTETPAKN